MITATTDIRSNVLKLIEARPGIDAEDIATYFDVPFSVADDLVADLFASGELAPANGP